MVYNYDSLWLHLYVAYIKVLVEDRYPDLDIRDAFARTTDGEDCPISTVHRPEELSSLAEYAGLKSEFLGATISLWELGLMERRFQAMQDRRLRAESRDFLAGLTFDERGIPYHGRQVAGIGGCYRLTPRP